MIRLNLSLAGRALIAGAVCLLVLGGMAVGHAWPLWTGRDVLLAATVNTETRSARGQSVRLSTPAELLQIGASKPADKLQWTPVRVVEPWVKGDPSRPFDVSRRLRGRTVYVQLEPTSGGDYAPVSVSLAPVAGAINLQGIVFRALEQRIRVQYGLDAYFMQEDHAALVRKAAEDKHRVQMKVAIASSGHARIRELLVNGVPVR